MVTKPITVARNDYMAAICAITNQANLPAFVVVEVLEKVAREMNVLVERELAMDMQSYREAVEKEKTALSSSDADPVPSTPAEPHADHTD